MSTTPTVEPLDERIDHVRGPAGAPLILEYGDYECPYSRQAFRAIERVEHELAGGVRFAFRHFPLVDIHPHALAAAAAAEAASLHDLFWQMHELLFHHQHALARLHRPARRPPYVVRQHLVEPDHSRPQQFAARAAAYAAADRTYRDDVAAAGAEHGVLTGGSERARG